MAKELPIAARIGALQVGLVSRARNIYENLDALEAMERGMKLSPENLALFRLYVRSIRSEITSIAEVGERGWVCQVHGAECVSPGHCKP